MNIFDAILSAFYKPKVIFSTNDLEKLQLKGRIYKVRVSCKKTSDEKYSLATETNKFDETERKYNKELAFNLHGYKMQELQYLNRSKKSYFVKIFEYNSDLLIKKEKTFSQSNRHTGTSNFDYVFRKKRFDQLIYFEDRLTDKNTFYYKNALKPFLIIKRTYLPNSVAEREIHFNEDQNIIKKTDSHFAKQTKYEFQNGKKIKSETSIEFDIITCIAKYRYENRNCVEKSFYQENGDLFRTDVFQYDNCDNWVKLTINYHGNCIYQVKRKIEYYKN